MQDYEKTTVWFLGIVTLLLFTYIVYNII